MENIRNFKLGDLCTIVGRIGFRGYTTADLVSSPADGAISLSPSNIINGELNLSKATYVSWEKYYESPEIMLHENDIVLSKTGTVGRTALVRKVEHPMTLNPQFVVLKDIKVNPVYLSYVLKTEYFQSSLKKITAGSVIPTLSQKDLASIDVFLPDDKTQDQIANALSCIDEKILLNEKINENLAC